MMKVETIEAVPVTVPRSRPFSSALGTSGCSQSGILRVRTDDGIEGVGEISLIWHGNGGALCHEVNNRLAPALLGEDPRRIALLHNRLEQLCEFGYHTNAIRAAFDMAFYDILGKSARLPVYALLGGKVRDRIDLSMSISMGSDSDMLEQADAYVTAGFRTLKVKVGRDREADVRAVGAIRKKFGDALQIRIDANMGWESAKEALEMIRRLNEFRLLSAEQPLHPRNLEGLRFVRDHSEVPIMVDESVWGPADSWRVIQAGAADIINVYVMESGGIFPALKIFHLAELAGIECAIGSMPEFGFGTAAQAHLGVAAPVLRHPSDVAGVLYLRDDLIRNALRIEDGFAFAPEGPGLGVDPDWEKIEFFRDA